MNGGGNGALQTSFPGIVTQKQVLVSCSSEKERLGKENILDSINLSPAKPTQV